MTAKSILNDNKYFLLSNKIATALGQKLIEDPEHIIVISDRNIALSTVSEHDIIKALYDQTDAIEMFSIIKYRSLEFEEQKQEYPKNEQPSEEELNEDTTEEILGMSQSFLLDYIIEFILTKYSPDRLLPYLKARRIPFAKKYKKQLISFYKKTSIEI